MNNDLEQFSEERLMAWISDDSDKTYHVDGMDLQYLARIALSVMQAVPAGYLENGKGFMYEPRHKDLIKNPTPVYTTSQPAHTEQDGWIKCSDDLPDETEDADGGATGYLVRYENDRVPNGGFNIGVSNCVFLRTHWRGLYTHWMPLPKPPAAAPKPGSE